MQESTHHIEIRRTYLGASPHTLATALIWLVGGLLGNFSTKGTAIAFFIVAGTFIFPLGELVRKFMKAPNLISRENKLPQLFMLLAFTIPMSYPLIYLACKSNINFFFPAFTILVGAHYLPFIFGYKMPTFGVLSFLLVILGSVCVLLYPAEFSLAAYLTSGLLMIFAIIHYTFIKKEMV